MPDSSPRVLRLSPTLRAWMASEPQGFLKQKSMVPVKRSIFKGMFTPLIRDAFNLGLRNDMIDQATNHQTAGWKGLRALEVQEMAEKGSNS